MVFFGFKNLQIRIQPTRYVISVNRHMVGRIVDILYTLWDIVGH